MAIFSENFDKSLQINLNLEILANRRKNSGFPPPGVGLMSYIHARDYYFQGLVGMDYKAELQGVHNTLTQYYANHCYFCNDAGDEELLVSHKYSIKLHRTCALTSISSMAKDVVEELRLNVDNSYHTIRYGDMIYPLGKFYGVYGVDEVFVCKTHAERVVDDIRAKRNRVTRIGDKKHNIAPKLKELDDNSVIGSMVWGKDANGFSIKGLVLGNQVERNEAKNTLSKYLGAYIQDKFGNYNVRPLGIEVNSFRALTRKGYANLPGDVKPTKKQEIHSQAFKQDKYQERYEVRGMIPCRDVNGELIEMREVVYLQEQLKDEKFGYGADYSEVKPKKVRTLNYHSIDGRTKGLQSSSSRSTRGESVEEWRHKRDKEREARKLSAQIQESFQEETRLRAGTYGLLG